MTEAEWLACDDPHPMLEVVRKRATKRKMRLFAVACCCHVRHLWIDKRCQEAVEIAERYADGRASQEELASAQIQAAAADEAACRRARKVPEADHVAGWAAWTDCDSAHAVTRAVLPSIRANFAEAARHAADAVRASGGLAAVRNGANVEEATGAALLALDKEQREQAKLARCLFGNPFRPIRIDTAWRTNSVQLLAESAYADRAFDRLPVLADALEEAGCTNVEILNHCRQPGEHFLGCWVVDLLLGKE